MAAKWSLFSNALQHPRVREFCDKQVELAANETEFTTHGHLSLLDIAINLEMAQGNSAEALRLAQSFIRVDPFSQRVQGLVKQLSAKKSLHELMSLAVPMTVNSVPENVDAKENLTQCTEQSMRVESYYSFCRLRIETEENNADVEWHLTYEHPEKFEVFQRIGDSCDRWFTFDGQSFHELHLLAQKVPENAWDGMPINNRLRIENVLHCLSSLRVMHCELDEEHQLEIHTGALSETPEWVKEYGAPADADCQLAVWIANDAGRPKWLTRFHLQAGPLRIDQTFAGFNQAQISLDAFD